MVDFAKIPYGRVETAWRCVRCGERVEYAIDLPEHMQDHFRLGNPCGGRLEKMSTRTVDTRCERSPSEGHVTCCECKVWEP